MNMGKRQIRAIKFVAVAVGLIAVSLVILGGQAEAALLDDLKAQIEVKNQEIKKLEEEAKAYREDVLAKGKEAQTLKNQISKIDLTINKLSGDIRLTQAQITRARLEVQDLGEDITAEELSIKNSKSGLKNLLTAIAQKDEEGLLVIATKYDSISGFFSAVNSMLGVGKGVGGKIVDLRNIKTQLENSKTKAEKKQREFASLSSTLNDQKAIQNDQRKERAMLLTETKNQEKRYQQLLDTTEAQQQAIQKEIEDLENKLRQTVDPGSLPPKRGGVFVWPAQGLMTQGYGRTAFARLSDFYSFHNGIDIKVLVGSPVFSADKGAVIATGDSDLYCRRGAYGKFIVIRHNNNLTTLYAHLSLIRVSAGQNVDRGEVIGYSGSTGLSTGPHLHFTAYDSRTVEVRQSRVCGFLPYGGSVNPLDYLQ
ncbi:MAG: peptidoglycan DD-metalloendopeptidase family protein [bacterium]|nr:peptidoglycan DD-metalloendopeptidase family protein [bacterium]